MKVVFCVDDNYAQHFGVTLASLLKNCSENAVPEVYVIDGGLSDDSKLKIESLVSIKPFSIQYVPISGEMLQHFPMTIAHISPITYARLILPSLLPDLEKVLYLDTDVIIDDDVSHLYYQSMNSETLVSAVLDPGIPADYLPSIGMDPTAFYFNAGILMMNLKAMRELDFENKCTLFLHGHKGVLSFQDQDILNAVCAGHVSWISPRYNLLQHYIKNPNK